jgi:hypothetical protein
MRKNPRITAGLWLGLSFSLIALADAPARPDQDPSEQTIPRSTTLRLSTGVVCRTINGYADYDPLPGAAQTSEEKLLVYIRPLGFATEFVDGSYQAHLVPDFQIRKRGQKLVLREKKTAFEYKPVSHEPPRLLYLKLQVSLKGLSPGDYNLNIIVHDEISHGPPASQVIKFRVIPTAELPSTAGTDADPARPEKPGQPSGNAKDSSKAGKAKTRVALKKRPSPLYRSPASKLNRARDEMWLFSDFDDFDDSDGPDEPEE